MGGVIFMKTPVEILLIEDNPAETRLIMEVFNENKHPVNIIGTKDGLEAIDYLYKKGKYENCKTPSLIILDLNLPKKNGLEVLEEIKTDNKLKRIPVIVLTGSTDDNDIFESYEHYANACMNKSADFDKFRKDIRAFKNYWFNNVVLPKKD